MSTKRQSTKYIRSIWRVPKANKNNKNHTPKHWSKPCIKSQKVASNSQEDPTPIKEDLRKNALSDSINTKPAKGAIHDSLLHLLLTPLWCPHKSNSLMVFGNTHINPNKASRRSQSIQALAQWIRIWFANSALILHKQHPLYQISNRCTKVKLRENNSTTGSLLQNSFPPNSYTKLMHHRHWFLLSR